jgi:hypothetical protein
MPVARLDDRDENIHLSHVFRVKVESGVNLRQAIKAFARDPHIMLAEPIPVARVLETPPPMPNDPFFPLSGEEIKILIAEQHPPGNYKVKWDANGLSSGLYFYRMTAGNLSATKKLFLLK